MTKIKLFLKPDLDLIYNFILFQIALDNGAVLDTESLHHVIDVANVLKMFLRELPEPLIPFKFHDIFLR